MPSEAHHSARVDPRTAANSASPHRGMTLAFSTRMLLAIVVVILAAGGLFGLGWAFWYGGFEGPIDWAMNTASHGSRDRRVIALTFDDGPDPQRTPGLLDALREL